MQTRHMFYNGSFYPESASEIERYIETFNRELPAKRYENIRALIVPHAGYIYSGFTANTAFSHIDTCSGKRFIVIGPSHRVAFEGMSISLHERYETPLGDLMIDTAYAHTLLSRFALAFEPAMHQEHSTEVQMPFIKHYAPDAHVIEMVYGLIDPEELSRIIGVLLEDTQNIIVVSTDLSHFYTEDEARALDNRCLEAIETLDTAGLYSGCEACGKIGIEALLRSAKRHNLQSQLLDYRTSAWASGDTSRVVGYTSALFTQVH